MAPADHDRTAGPRRVPTSAVAAFIDTTAIETLLEPWIDDPHDRAFVLRCLLGEGPAHHRGANFVLLRLIGEIIARLEAAVGPDAHQRLAQVVRPDQLATPMRLPPHLQRAEAPLRYPLGLVASAIDRLAPRGSEKHAAMVDCLIDGPPQHALANVAIVNLLDVVLRQIEAMGGPIDTARGSE